MKKCSANNHSLLTLPSPYNHGGVSSFYNAVLPYLPETITPMVVGGAKGIEMFFRPLMDQLHYHQAVKTNRPILIHLNPSLGLKCFLRDGLFALQAKQQNIPLLIFWHGWDKSFEGLLEKRLLWFFRHTFGQADGFIVLASEFKQKLKDWGVEVPIYLGTTAVEEQLLQHFDLEKKLTRLRKIKTVKILFLARLERAKGVFETVQAIKLLVDKKLPVCLTIAGDGEIRQELEEYTRTLNLTPQQVNFTGDIRGKDKISAFAEHHIYCFPTFYGEGLPTSVLEAMAFGMPVVTRPVGGLADIFEDGKMGALVQGKSPEEIADCLEKIISDRNQMAEIGRYNAGYAKEHFMASVVAKRLLGIYEDLGVCK